MSVMPPRSAVAAAVLLAALCLPFSIAGTNAALGLLTLALLIRARGAEDRATLVRAWREEPLLAALAAYAAAGFISGLLGVDPDRSLRESPKDLHRLWAALLFLGAFALEDIRGLRPALALSFSVSALWGIAQVAHHALFVRLPLHPIARAHGSLHPVAYGESLVIAGLGVLCLLASPPRKDAPAGVSAAVLGLLAGALILNQTRSASFALAAGFFIVAALEPRARRWTARLAAAAAAVLILWELLPTGGRSLLNLFENIDPRNPNQVRLTLWSVAWRMFLDHPWSGAGPGHYGTLFTRYFDGLLDNQRSWSSAHNLYLHQLAERGLLGGAALAGVLWTLSARAWHSARRAAGPETLWAAAATAAFLVMNLTETVFQNELISTFLLLVWCGGAAAASRKNL